MYTVDLYLRVRLACHVDGLSQREAASRFGIARETVRKMLRHSEPPGYRRRQPPKRPKLAPFTDIIDRILEEDRTVHHKQHHTAKRIFERLRNEHGFTGKETIVKDYGWCRKVGGKLENWRKLLIVKHSERRCAAAERSLRHETSYGIDVAQSIFR